MTAAVLNPAESQVEARGSIIGARRGTDRRLLAASRAANARAALADCRLCAQDCGVNRLRGETGVCKAGPLARVFSAQVEVGDELELVPTFAIALSGCDLRCAFCVTGAESWNAAAGDKQSPAELGREAARAIARGSRSVMILGGEPTIHLPAALEIIAALPADAKVVWKTNAHGSSQARELLDGIVDVWLADNKFGNDGCALALAGVRDYTAVIRENLCWMAVQSELIVRHLLMPGHIECCWRPIAAWLAQRLPGVKTSLRTEFWPAWQARTHPELQRTLATTERNRGLEIAAEFNLNLIP